MKKSELKNIIKECVREVIFEEGVLSNIVTEVANGLSANVVIQERTRKPLRHETPPSQSASRRQVLEEIGNKSYESIKNKFKNPQLFEGTKPIPAGNSQGAPLAGMDPSDRGVDISNIPGFQNWGRVARKE